MLTFTDARRLVEAAIPGGGETAAYGYESDRYWFPVVLPDRLGGRVPGVAKSTGAVTWMSSISEEYSNSRPYGALRP